MKKLGTITLLACLTLMFTHCSNKNAPIQYPEAAMGSDTDSSLWKVGENVAENFLDKPAVYDIAYIYKDIEDGSLVTLSEDELISIGDEQPDFYDTYEFVDSKKSIISEFERAPYKGFNMLDFTGSDMASEILLSKEPVYIFFMHNLNETNIKVIQNKEFNRIVNNCLDNGITVVGISNSDGKTIRKFCQDNNILFPIYENLIDPVYGPFMVRDAIHSNPGLIIIQGGIVKEKYNWIDFEKVKTENGKLKINNE